jgi:protein O-mannosyl-transferase
MAKMHPVPPSTATKKSPWSSPWIAILAITAAALLAYHNSFGVPFVFDDELAIVANPSIRSWWTSFRPPADLQGLPISGRPVVNVSLGLSYAMSGSAVWSYHCFNLLIHIAAGGFLFGIVRRTLLQPLLAPRFGTQAFGLALLAAVLWVVHPLQTESVTYISQRAEAMVGLFYFMAVWFSIRALEPGASKRWMWGALVCGLLGMATKEVMVSAPLFVAIYARAFVVGSWREVWTRHQRLMAGLASSWLLLAIVVVHEGGARGASAGFGLGVSPWTYLLTQCDALVLYLKLSFWPHPLILDYGIPLVHSVAEVWWQGAIIVGLFSATVWAVIRRPALGCLGAWFFMILAPSSSVVPLVGQTIAEHRMYLPLAAIVVGAVISIYSLLGRKGMIVSGVMAVALIVVTVRRNQDYATTISICEDTVAKRPDNARAMALLADYYRRAGKLPEARKWLERSLEIQPGVRPVLNNLGNVWQELGEPAKAVDYFKAALALRPGDVQTMNNLGNALVLAGRVDEGVAQLETAIQTSPNAWEARFNLASVLAQSGRMEAAAAQFELLVKERPDDAEAHNRYADVLLALGRKTESLAQLETAVRAQPENADLHNRLGSALGRQGRMREALEQFEAALKLNPSHASALQNAALARRKLGRD